MSEEQKPPPMPEDLARTVAMMSAYAALVAELEAQFKFDASKLAVRLKAEQAAYKADDLEPTRSILGFLSRMVTGELK